MQKCNLTNTQTWCFMVSMASLYSTAHSLKAQNMSLTSPVPAWSKCNQFINLTTPTSCYIEITSYPKVWKWNHLFPKNIENKLEGNIHSGYNLYISNNRACEMVLKDMSSLYSVTLWNKKQREHKKRLLGHCSILLKFISLWVQMTWVYN